MEEDSLDAPLSWEDFFGGSSAADLVPTLLHMYDTLACGASPTPIQNNTTTQCVTPPVNRRPTISRPAVPPPPRPSGTGKPPRPLSAASSCSSSSSSGEAGGAVSATAYLASTESLEAGSSEDEEEQGIRRVTPRRRLALREGSSLLHRQSGSSAGSADSGVGGCNNISAPCPPPARPRYYDPHLSFMDRVVMEIVETEAVYVRDLQEVVQGYLNMWRESPDCPIEPQQLADLFSNMESILRFNSGFLKELESCGLDPVSVARCFVRHTPGFRIYTEYCTGYPRTVSVLTQLMRKEETVRLCRERQAALHHSLPLGSFLLKPVQRILKYHLLLQNIVKQFPSDSGPEHDVVEEALGAMTSLAQHINEMKRRHEHAVRVQEIQSLLLDWQGADLTTLGELCAEGTFRMCGAKALRHAFLFDKMLLIAKRSGDALSCKTHIECSNLMLIESITGEPLSFHVIPFDNPRVQYTFQARSLEQKREWSQQLKKVILENYSAVIPTHARQLVMQLGQGRSEEELLAERSTPRRQHTAPEYLQKRQQERRRSETGLLPSRLRRSRRSDAGLHGREGSSPTLPRRKQRSASASRESEDTVNEQLAPQNSNTSTEKLKDRFYNWHRKTSEPYCSRTLPSKLSQLFSAERRSTSISPAPEANSPSQEPEASPNTSVEQDSQAEQEMTPELPAQVSEEQRRQASLEEIVGELVLHNVGLKRALRRSRSAGRPRDSVDSSSDCEQRSPRQRVRAQRLARMCALRQQQEHLQRLEWQESFLHKWQQQRNPYVDEPKDEPKDEPEDIPIMPEQQQPQPEEVNQSEEVPSEPESPVHSNDGSHRSGALRGVLASLGSRLRVNSTETLAEAESLPSCPVDAMYKQGSSCLGARIAQSSSCEYADPQTLMKRPNQDYYEETLAAVLDEEEAFRDSAIFSDEHDDTTDVSPLPPRPIKVPPPVPAKPKISSPAKAVWRTMEAPKPHFCNQSAQRENDLRSINCTPRPNGFKPWVKTSNSAEDLLEEMKPLNLKSASVSICQQSSTCSQSEGNSEFLEVQPKPKGWVKHVVGKIQASADSS